MAFAFYQPINNRQKLGIEGKTRLCLEVKKIIKPENVQPHRRQAPLAQWTSVLDF